MSGIKTSGIMRTHLELLKVDREVARVLLVAAAREVLAAPAMGLVLFLLFVVVVPLRLPCERQGFDVCESGHEKREGAAEKHTLRQLRAPPFFTAPGGFLRVSPPRRLFFFGGMAGKSTQSRD